MTPEDAFKHPWIKAGIKELKEKMEKGNSFDNSQATASVSNALPIISD